MNASSIVSSSLVFCGIIVIAVSIPILLGKISRNPFYGFRTQLSLSSDEVWYATNRFAAKGLILSGALNLLIGVISFWFHPLSDGVQLLLVVLPLSVFLPCLISYVWMNKKFGP